VTFYVFLHCFTRFLELCCSLIEVPIKLVTTQARQNYVFGDQKPLNRFLQNFACRVSSTT